jgi:hypothetical protein
MTYPDPCQRAGGHLVVPGHLIMDGLEGMADKPEHLHECQPSAFNRHVW